MRTISLFSELLTQESAGKLDAPLQEYLAQVSRNAKRMEALITDLISYSHIDDPQTTHELISVEECLRRSIELLAVSIKENEAVIDCDVPMTTRLRGNATQFTQLFQNLISNALKFRRPDVAPRIKITASVKGKEWLFTVRDNGIGFDPTFKNEIFLLFRRVHKIETYPGTGMGLALCKKIVEQHRGRIWAESTVGEGAVFYFTLPQMSAGV